VVIDMARSGYGQGALFLLFIISLLKSLASFIDFDSPMDKKDTNPPELAQFRQQIDALDDKIIELLIERIGIVSQVGAWKRKNFPDQCPIRAGREADMVRRVAGKFEGTAFPPAAAATMWRLLIGASTNVEGALKLSVLAADKDNDLYWLAREYFGPFIPATKQPIIKRVIGDVMDGTASVGIIPPIRNSDTTNWWTDLIRPGNTVKIFAQLPFVHYGQPGMNTPIGFAIARIDLEPTGDDVSLLVLELDHNVSQSRLQTLFASANLEPNWINIVTLTQKSRHHLIEVKGFVAPDHPGIKSLQAALGRMAMNIHFLGAYATPMVIISDHRQTTDHGANYHAARTAK
jgi:chorismate mutase / prephenate dehydratase